MAVIQGPNPGALSEALAKILQVHNNRQALADPEGMLWYAQVAWMQAMTDAVIYGTGAVLMKPDGSAQAVDLKPTADEIAALQAQEADLQARVAAGQVALAAFDAALHPATIAPANPGV